MINIYGITGFFREGPFISTFGGVFRSEHGELEGMLIDDCGHSTIKGKIEKTKLEFDKFYDNRQFGYSFTRHESGIWIGEYIGSGGRASPQIRGSAWCKINIDWENLDFKYIKSDEASTEEDLVNLLIRTGGLRPVDS